VRASSLVLYLCAHGVIIMSLTIDEDSYRTELYYIIFSLVILIRLEVGTIITRILDSPQALRFISMRNVQTTA